MRDSAGIWIFPKVSLTFFKERGRLHLFSLFDFSLRGANQHESGLRGQVQVGGGHLISNCCSCLVRTFHEQLLARHGHACAFFQHLFDFSNGLLRSDREIDALLAELH